MAFRKGEKLGETTGSYPEKLQVHRTFDLYKSISDSLVDAGPFEGYG
jgi:hypothetical protein